MIKPLGRGVLSFNKFLSHKFVFLLFKKIFFKILILIVFRYLCLPKK